MNSERVNLKLTDVNMMPAPEPKISMSVRRFLTESLTGRTVVIFPPEGPIARTERAVDPCSEIALCHSQQILAVISKRIQTRKRWNLLVNERKLTPGCLNDFCHSFVAIVVVDHNVGTQTFDIGKVGR